MTATDLAVDVSSEGVRAPLARARVADLVRGVLRAERVRHAMISVAFLDEAEMARLNWRHLRHRGPTDVISFGLTSAPGAPVVGDIYVSPAVVRTNARANRRPVREELARVVIHGVLHVLGHDHPDGEERVGSPMWRRQERLLGRLTGGARA
jgi:probable rRNA maturation factor